MCRFVVKMQYALATGNILVKIFIWPYSSFEKKKKICLISF